ncbi:hypothetical protein [Chryseobacterium wangxinyae]|uniref:hypothetical protein n=1 Tax=Chryseobacterium sp. CY353 TaxID=2997334 RepID=UPI00226EDA0C|nr:hypothetical protein [Chryseobacterium sp. CY353]MCY0969566.1 hypothetical protein [Chryseobacterium sp. CY353]
MAGEKIVFLQKHGKVMMVRLPQSSKIREIEQGYMPNFSNTIKTVSEKHGVKFIDYSYAGDEYNYVDGNHLQKDSGKELTKKLDDSLKKYFK